MRVAGTQTPGYLRILTIRSAGRIRPRSSKPTSTPVAWPTFLLHPAPRADSGVEVGGTTGPGVVACATMRTDVCVSEEVRLREGVGGRGTAVGDAVGVGVGVGVGGTGVEDAVGVVVGGTCVEGTV